MSRNLPTIYLIPGLGADARMYQFLHLDTKKFKKVVLNWLPYREQESLKLYALRMAEQIPETNQPLLLVGVSFGGMIAVEIGKHRPGAFIFLISSIKTITELPGYLRILGKTNIHNYLPLHWAKNFPGLYNWIFGANTVAEKKMLGEIIRDTDIPFVKWALTAIVHWQNRHQVPNMVHIHSHQDMIFPLAYIHKPNIVYKGGHLIIFSAAQEISQVINQAANQIFYSE